MKMLQTLFSKIFAFTLLTLIGFTSISCEDKQPETCKVSQEAIDAMKENHLIPLNQAINMYDKYDKLRIKFFNDSLKRRYGTDFEDTRNIWFDITTIKAYIQYIEENASDAEGLAFYFGVNADNSRQGKNHQSFFIAPTVKNGDRQSGFTTKNGKRIFLYEAFKESQESNTMQKGAFFSLLQGEDGLLLNDGSTNPPGTGD